MFIIKKGKKKRNQTKSKHNKEAYLDKEIQNEYYQELFQTYAPFKHYQT